MGEACWRIPEGRGDGIGHGWRKRYSWFQSRCRLLKLDVTFVTSCKGCAKEWLVGMFPESTKVGCWVFGCHAAVVQHGIHLFFLLNASSGGRVRGVPSQSLRVVFCT